MPRSNHILAADLPDGFPGERPTARTLGLNIAPSEPALDLARRDFMRRALGGASAFCLPGFLAACGGGGSDPPAPALRSNLADLGPLQAADTNGLALPAGFSARVVARSGAALPGGGYAWHTAPDGGATFATADGGWIYVSNSEAGANGGGVGALRFDAQGNVVAQYAICSGTNRNCAGGATPWGTWLTCEETPTGRVWECDPQQAGSAIARPALGLFQHEGLAVDAPRRQLFLTEDTPDGRLYRFVCSDTDWPAGAARPALQNGSLQVLVAEAALPAAGDLTTSVPVRWKDVLDATVAQSTVRDPQATAFNGGEGIWCSDGIVVFATKGDNRVWRYDALASRLSVIYDDNAAGAGAGGTGTLTGVDNVLVSFAGDVLVAEDGGNMEIRALGSGGATLALLRVTGQDTSEITGPAFSPDGSRLYFSSQRGPGVAGNNGVTYEVSGPFFVAA